MNPTLSRRQFLGTSTAAAGLALAPSWARAAVGNASRFSFVLLGDLHFDRLDHHDMNWVRKEKPQDVRQIENYRRITREVVDGASVSVRMHAGATREVWRTFDLTTRSRSH